MTRKPFLVALLIVWLSPIRSYAGELWGDLEPGRYDAGFDRVWELDRSRVWPRSPFLDSLEGPVARPIRVDVWYPASCESGESMLLRRYVEIEPPGPEFEDLVFLAHRWDEYSYRGLAEEDATYERLMNTETGACWKAPPQSGRFPLVLYSAGWFNRAPDNTILAEFLASHGFVVATVPQLNPGLWTFEFASDARGVENQIRDLEVALGLLIERPFVDRRRVASMGYSTGGDVALLLQGRNPLIDAAVGLDASWTLGSNNDVAGSPFFDAARHEAPILAIRRPTLAEDEADAVLDSLRFAPRLVVEVPGGDHGSFSDDPAQRRLLGDGTAEAQSRHAVVSRVVIEFLKAALGASVPSFAGGELVERYEDAELEVDFRPGARKPSKEESDS